MLRTLDIENIAVIEKTSVEFSQGLNVLTGETGAGKSIVVDSINAILGERTSKELVRNGADNAFVSAYFDDIAQPVIDKLRELDFDTDEDNTLLISRKISANGKSICKINGKSATVSMLKEIGSLLVNIHGQHDNQALLNPDYHCRYIDMLLDDSSVIDQYKQSFRELISVRRRLKRLTEDETDKERRLEILDYQIDELEKAEIVVGEKERLLSRRNLIEKSEAIAKALNDALSAINGDDENMGAFSLIDSSYNSTNSFPELSEISEALLNACDKIEVSRDLLENMLARIEYDSEELERIGERLDLLYRLSAKYGATEEDMLSYLEKAREERNAIVNYDDEIERLTEEYDKLYKQTVIKADNLSSERKKTASAFEASVMNELQFLDMSKLKFVVSFDKGKLSSNGYDTVQFLISANPGEPPKPLSKIASGGELSRIMLAIKNILAYNDTIDTLIFDEVDTGVSGRASQKIGLKLKSVSESTQVICVTHSAQIASNADTHFLIKKEYEGDRTFTNVSPLDFEGRKYELARIMGGLEITEALLKSAEELLNN